MKKSTFCHIILVVMATVTFVGCSDRVAVTGTVTYADGSPVQVGQVVFTDDKLAFRGSLDQNGAYKLGGIKNGDGITPGRYQIYLIDTETTETDEKGNTRAIKHVAQKYLDPETSEITCEIKGKMDFDFEVKRP